MGFRHSIEARRYRSNQKLDISPERRESPRLAPRIGESAARHRARDRRTRTGNVNQVPLFPSVRSGGWKHVIMEGLEVPGLKILELIDIELVHQGKTTLESRVGIVG